MLELSLEQMKRLAEIVYPGKEWCRPILPGHPDYNGGKDTEADYVAYFDFDGPEDLEIRFNPSLTGEDWQLAQALRVIVAAFKVKPSRQFNTELIYSPAGFSFLFCERMAASVSKIGPEPDLLTAAALALLAKE